MSDKVTWEDPSPINSGRGRTIWQPLLAPLDERPGSWALIREGKLNTIRNAASDLRAGRMAIEVGAYEFTTRSNGNGTAKLYARYVGAEAAS